MTEFDDLPEFPFDDDDSFQPPEYPKKDEKVVMLCETISPELAEWFSNLNIYDRELIIMDAYLTERVGKLQDRQIEDGGGY